MDYAAFLRSAERGAPPALALLHGADAQLADDAIAAATRGLTPDADAAALSREVFDGREADVDQVVRSASTLPLVAGRRLVVVRHAQALPARGAEALAEYARTPNPAACLLLVADEPLTAGGERRADHWLLGALPPAAVVALPAPHARELPAWLTQRAALEGLTVSDEAARLLVELVGEDGLALLGEARKAALAGGPDNRTVGVREVAAVVGERRLGEVFELVRAVERRDIGAALRTLERLLVSEDPLRLLALLVGHTRTVLVVAELSARGRSVEEIGRALRRPPRVAEALVRAAGGTPRATILARLARCWEVERRLKSSGEPRAELTALVAELCGPR